MSTVNDLSSKALSIAFCCGLILPNASYASWYDGLAAGGWAPSIPDEPARREYTKSLIQTVVPAYVTTLALPVALSTGLVGAAAATSATFGMTYGTEKLTGSSDQEAITNAGLSALAVATAPIAALGPAGIATSAVAVGGGTFGLEKFGGASDEEAIKNAGIAVAIDVALNIIAMDTNTRDINIDEIIDDPSMKIPSEGHANRPYPSNAEWKDSVVINEISDVSEEVKKVRFKLDPKDTGESVVIYAGEYLRNEESYYGVSSEKFLDKRRPGSLITSEMYERKFLIEEGLRRGLIKYDENGFIVMVNDVYHPNKENLPQRIVYMAHDISANSIDDDMHKITARNEMLDEHHDGLEYHHSGKNNQSALYGIMMTAALIEPISHVLRYENVSSDLQFISESNKISFMYTVSVRF